MNPLAIRIAANLAEFKANMAEMRTQLETNASAMKRMSNSFDGSRVISDANAMAKAIHDIGGASKLTDAEMRRVNSTVTEAIAKYQALGRSAPSDLIALRDATAKVNVEAAKTPTIMDQMSSKATAFGVAAGTFLGNMAWSAVNKLGAELGEFAKRGIELNAVQSSFERLARSTNQSSFEMLSSMQKASRGLVAEFDLMKAANKAMLLGLPVTTESMGTLAKAATTLGRAMGQDATKSVDDLITALGRSSPMILDNLGITVKVGEANEVYAAKLGKTVEQLSEAEKKTAFYEEAMRKANDRTKELGESTKTLGERLQTAWVSIGNIVTGVVSDYNIGLGAALSNTRSFGNFLSVAMTQGLGAAVQLFAQMERGRGIVEQLTASEKLATAALLKKGETVQQIARFLGQSEAAVQAYVKSLEKIAPAASSAGSKSSKAAKDIKESWSGTFNEIFNYSKAWQAEQDAIAASMKNASWSGTAADIDKFNFALRETLNISKEISWSGIESDLTRLRGILNDVAEEVGTGFKGSLSKALEGLGGVIVGAIQGGGDVARSAFAHVGQSLGSDLGAWIQKGLGGSLGKILGGFAGPLGALLGSGLGGLIGGIFGKNQGREDAKGFASGFGGFDALREQMLKLGAEGDRLWIALTQNSKGPEQVAATIRLIEEALRKAEEQAGKTGDTLKDTFEGPEGARGFPTREQLQKAAADAEETWRYIKDSGKYNAAQVEQAWEQWQDALVAAGDTSIQKVRELDKEIKSLQDAIAMEPPEFDAEGNRMYGVEEWNNIQKLQAAEAERAKLTQAQIKEEMDAREAAAEFATGLVATQIDDEQKLREDALKDIAAMTGVEMAEQVKAGEMAAQAASKTAQKEFDTAKTRAKDLDAYLTKLFTGGYEIPITFKLPNGVPGGQPSTPAPWFGGSTSGVSSAPSVVKGSGAPILLTVVTTLDGKVVAQNQAKHLPAELEFIGARR